MKKVIKCVHPLQPIYNHESRILILGSFPSVISRQKSYYYANPSNRFWHVMSILFEESIADYKSFCLYHKIAMWDVIQQCEIHGSNDNTIKNIIVNDINVILKCAKISKIFLTGKKAYQLYIKYIHTDVEYMLLPSTSSANAKMHLEDLIAEYRVIKNELEQKN